ncbi:MAG: hypothetical protein ACHQQQ_14450 [Bacteroidota bacterium]
MKSFTRVLVIACFTISLFPGLNKLIGQEKITGVYSVFAKDKVIQTDSYEITPGKTYIDDMKGIAGGESDRRYEMTLDNNKFQSMEKKVAGIVVSSIKYSAKMFSFYDNDAMSGMLADETNPPVFEAAAFSHYALLVDLYQKTGDGKQTVSVVIPALQDLINVEIERHGSDAFNIGEQSLTATHYRFAIGKKRETVNLWTDNHKVIAIYLASNDRFVVDNSYPNLYESIKKVINRAM